MNNEETVRRPLEHPVGRWQYQRCGRGWEVYEDEVVICWLEDQPWAESNARRICEIGDLPEGFARRASRIFCENTRLRAENEMLREALEKYRGQVDNEGRHSAADALTPNAALTGAAKE